MPATWSPSDAGAAWNPVLFVAVLPTLLPMVLEQRGSFSIIRDVKYSFG